MRSRRIDEPTFLLEWTYGPLDQAAFLRRLADVLDANPMAHLHSLCTYMPEENVWRSDVWVIDGSQEGVLVEPEQ